MELEKIRAADTQVRWQDDEDVDECRSCKSNFTVTRRKVRTIQIFESVSIFAPIVISFLFFYSIIVAIVDQFTVKNACQRQYHLVEEISQLAFVKFVIHC